MMFPGFEALGVFLENRAPRLLEHRWSPRVFDVYQDARTYCMHAAGCTCPSCERHMARMDNFDPPEPRSFTGELSRYKAEPKPERLVPLPDVPQDCAGIYTHTWTRHDAWKGALAGLTFKEQGQRNNNAAERLLRSWRTELDERGLTPFVRVELEPKMVVVTVSRNPWPACMTAIRFCQLNWWHPSLTGVCVKWNEP